jgi:hypothetical protein
MFITYTGCFRSPRLYETLVVWQSTGNCKEQEVDANHMSQFSSVRMFTCYSVVRSKKLFCCQDDMMAKGGYVSRVWGSGSEAECSQLCQNVASPQNHTCVWKTIYVCTSIVLNVLTGTTSSTMKMEAACSSRTSLSIRLRSVTLQKIVISICVQMFQAGL